MLVRAAGAPPPLGDAEVPLHSIVRLIGLNGRGEHRLPVREDCVRIFFALLHTPASVVLWHELKHDLDKCRRIRMHIFALWRCVRRQRTHRQCKPAFCDVPLAHAHHVMWNSAVCWVTVQIELFLQELKKFVNREVKIFRNKKR